MNPLNGFGWRLPNWLVYEHFYANATGIDGIFESLWHAKS